MKKAKEQKKSELDKETPSKPVETSFIKYSVDENQEKSTISDQTNRYEQVTSYHQGGKKYY